MSEGLLREVEVSFLSGLLKSPTLASDLVKAGFRPDLLPSPEGRELARMILRVRDARGDVSEDVEAQMADIKSLGVQAARLLSLAQDTPCPDRQQALAFLAALELSESNEQLQATDAKINDLLGPSPSGRSRRAGTDSSRATSSHQFRRVRLPHPKAPIPGRTPAPPKPEND